MRVVLDTNVVVSSLVFRGSAARLRELWQAGRIVPLVCRPTVIELMRVLGYPKFRLTADDQQALLADYLPWCETVIPPTPPPPTPPCDDPNDVMFLQLALAARADAIVSGDAAVLGLRGNLGLPILTVAELLDRVPLRR